MTETTARFNRAVVKQTIAKLTSRVIHLAHRMENGNKRYTPEQMDAIAEEFRVTCNELLQWNAVWTEERF